MNNLKVSFYAVTLILSIALAAGTSAAFPSLTDQKSTCTDDNCRALSVRGTYVHFQSDGATKAIPAVYQIFSNGGECVRLEVTHQDSDLDLAATMVCPDGTIWQDDDSGGNLRPLIAAITPSVSGWCTVQFASWDGDGLGSRNFVGDRDFRFRYGRYARNNPNCANPTEPLTE